MSTREFIALGTGSQVPTRQRNHNGYFLRWDAEGFLFDPGEGTQRQMTFGDIPARAVHRVFVTHFHGDHCLGLAGMIQRLSLDRCEHPVHVYYPARGEQFFERLRYASIYHPAVTLVPCPVQVPDHGLVQIAEGEKYCIYAHSLDHGVPTVGYRLVEKPGRRMIPEKLNAAGIEGPMVGELIRTGKLTVSGREFSVEELSSARDGNIFAFVMDTRPCPGADALASGADLLVMEATYTAVDQALATEHGHSSSVDAALTAKRAGATRLAMTHFSQRYLDTDAHLAEARAIFVDTVALRDFDKVTIRRRA